MMLRKLGILTHWRHIVAMVVLQGHRSDEVVIRNSQARRVLWAVTILIVWNAIVRSCRPTWIGRRGILLRIVEG